MRLEDRGRVGSEQGCMSHDLSTPSVGGPISRACRSLRVEVRSGQVSSRDEERLRASVRKVGDGVEAEKRRKQGGSRPKAGVLANEFLAKDCPWAADP